MISHQWLHEVAIKPELKDQVRFFSCGTWRTCSRVNLMITPWLRIGKGDRSLSVLSLSFKFHLVWLLMFCFRLHNSSKSIISGFTTFHHHSFSRNKFWKQINLQKAVKDNERKKLISSINILRDHKT